MTEEKKDKPPKKDVKTVTVVNDVAVQNYTLQIVIGDDSRLNISAHALHMGRKENNGTPKGEEIPLDGLLPIAYETYGALADFSEEFQKALLDFQHELEVLIIEKLYPEGEA